MSVCVSVVSAGVSVVLIKYTGNVWLQTEFYGFPSGGSEPHTVCVQCQTTVGLPMGKSGTIAMIGVLAGYEHQSKPLLPNCCSITRCRTCEFYF